MQCMAHLIFLITICSMIAKWHPILSRIRRVWKCTCKPQSPRSPPTEPLPFCRSGISTKFNQQYLSLSPFLIKLCSLQPVSMPTSVFFSTCSLIQKLKSRWLKLYFPLLFYPEIPSKRCPFEKLMWLKKEKRKRWKLMWLCIEYFSSPMKKTS